MVPSPYTSHFMNCSFVRFSSSPELASEKIFKMPIASSVLPVLSFSSRSSLPLPFESPRQIVGWPFFFAYASTVPPGNARIVAGFSSASLTSNTGVVPRSQSPLRSAIKVRPGQPVNAPLLTALESETDMEPLDWKDVWLRGLELCAQVMGYREDAIYDADALAWQITGFCRAEALPGKLDEAALHEAWKAGPRQTFALLTRWLYEHGEFPKELERRLGELPMETAAAFFMHALAVMA